MGDGSDDKAKKPKASPPAKTRKLEKAAAELEIDEIRPDRRIGKQIRLDPIDRNRW